MGYIPPIEHYISKGHMGVDECREQWLRDYTAEPLSVCSPLMVTLAVAVIAWASFCVGMWIGRIETLASVNAAERVEAE